MFINVYNKNLDNQNNPSHTLHSTFYILLKLNGPNYKNYEVKKNNFDPPPPPKKGQQIKNVQRAWISKKIMLSPMVKQGPKSEENLTGRWPQRKTTYETGGGPQNLTIRQSHRKMNTKMTSQEDNLTWWQLQRKAITGRWPQQRQ